MKLLVTGAAGMLGSALCPTLREEGHDVSATHVRLIGPGLDHLDVRDCSAVARPAATSDPTGSCTLPRRPAWRRVRPTSSTPI